MSQRLSNITSVILLWVLLCSNLVWTIPFIDQWLNADYYAFELCQYRDNGGISDEGEACLGSCAVDDKIKDLDLNQVKDTSTPASSSRLLIKDLHTECVFFDKNIPSSLIEDKDDLLFLSSNQRLPKAPTLLNFTPPPQA